MGMRVGTRRVLLGDSPAAVLAQSLRQKTLAYYAGADLTDSTGHGYTLTNNNGVTFAAGKIGNGFDLEFESSQWLSNTDSAFNFTTGDFTLLGWIKIESAIDPQTIADRSDSPGGNFRGYSVYYSGGSLGFGIFGTGTATVTHSTPPTVGQLHMITARRRAAANRIDISLDGGAWQSADSTGVSITSAEVDFCLGANTGGLSGQFDGILDEWLVSSAAISDAELAHLWNGGAGRTWPLV